MRRLISQDTEQAPNPKTSDKKSPASSDSADQGGKECSSAPPAATPTGGPEGDEAANPCGEETKTVSESVSPASVGDDGIQVPPEASQPEAKKAATDTAQENPSGSDAGVNEVGSTSDKSAPAPESSHLLGDMLQIRQGVASDRVISVQDPEIRHGQKSASNRFDGHKQSVVVDTTASKLIRWP